MRFIVRFAVGILFFPLERLNLLLHETGHALVAIWLSKEKATIYIGSYGDTHGNLEFKTGLLEWHIRYNIFRWKGGMCIAHGNDKLSSNQKILYTLAGPLFPFLIGILSFGIFYITGPNMLALFITGVFCLISLGEIIDNLLLTSKPVVLSDGTILYNDGKMIRDQWNFQKARSLYYKAGEHYQQGNHLAAVPHLERGLLFEPHNIQMHSLLLTCWMEGKEYAKAKTAAKRCIQHCKPLTESVTIRIAEVYFHMKEYERALHYYTETLKINPQHFQTLYNKGMLLNLLGYNEKAIPYLKQAIMLDASDASSHCQLALAQIRTGALEEAAQSLSHSLRLDDSNGFIYRNLGLYHMEKREYKKAYKAFMESKVKGYKGDDLETLLTEVKALDK